jgi:GntR family transcriptional repressor for pyruvate dehydrogenase complex
MKSIERIPIVDQVADNLKEFIMSGEVGVGDKLPTEMELCKKLGVGRGTVREALRILQANGFVDILPGRGAFVARVEDLSIDEIVKWFVTNEVELKDCFEVRNAIEVLAVKLTIERVNDSDIEEIEAIHNKFLAAVEAHDSEEIALYDEEFHSIIMEKSRNKLLISISSNINECIKSFRSKTFKLEQNVLNAVEPHNNILKAIKDRDPEAGQLFMARHIQKIMDDLDSSIKN